MGLFSFLKKSGAKILTNKNVKKVETKEVKTMRDEILRKQKIILLKGVVKNTKIKVENMDLNYTGSKVTIYGQVGTQAGKEKVILALGNVAGIGKVDDRISVVKKAPKAEFYTVKKGDSLSKIAKKFYGKAGLYKVIFKANKPMLKDPSLIYPGQVLRIPPQGK